MLVSLAIQDRNGVDVVLHETEERGVISVQGLFGIETLRESRRPLSTGHGAIDDTEFGDGKLITWEQEIMSTAGHSDALAEFRAITKPLLETLDYGPALLKWTEGGEGDEGLELQQLVKLADGTAPSVQDGAAMLTFPVEVFAEDPRAYSQTLESEEGNPLSEAAGGKTYLRPYPKTYTQSGGGEVTVDVAGNRPTPPLYRIHGRCLNPQILNLDTGDRLVFDQGGVLIPTGSYLEVDTARPRRSIALNGTVPQPAYLRPAVSTWFELPADQETNLRLLADDFDGNAKLEVFWRPANA